MLSMNKYQIKNSIGSGNFSKVFKVEDPQSHETYALKVMKTHHKIALREAKILSKMNHPNVIKLFNFQQNQNESKLLLEFVGINTLELYQAHSFGLRQEQVKCILFQAALGLAYVHTFGVINRDVKPENILIDKRNALVKIIDFGLAINQKQVSTDYIATRWYRAPQNLLGTKEYTCSVDVFSLACVIVELYLGGPLFPGSDNVDQIYKIFSILGYPTEENWPLGYQRANFLGIKMNNSRTIMDLKSILNPCDPMLVDILQKMLQLNPADRIKCSDIVKHAYFKDVKIIVPPFVYQRFQEDYLGKTPTSNTTHTKTSSTDANANQHKSKFDKLAFKGVHQLKQPKGIKQSLQLSKNLSNKSNFLKSHINPSSFKSLQHFQKTKSKKNSSVSSIDSHTFTGKISKISRTDSLDKKITHFPSTLVRARNKTQRNVNLSSQKQVSENQKSKEESSIINNFSILQNPPQPPSPTTNLTGSCERLTRNYSEVTKPITTRLHRDNSGDVCLQKNSESSRKQVSRERIAVNNSSTNSKDSHHSPAIRMNRSPAVFPINSNIQLRVVKNHQTESQPFLQPQHQPQHQHQHQHQMSTTHMKAQTPRINNQSVSPHFISTNIHGSPHKEMIHNNGVSKIIYQKPMHSPNDESRLHSPNLPQLRHSPSMPVYQVYKTPPGNQASPQLSHQYLSPERRSQPVTPFSPTNAYQKNNMSPSHNFSAPLRHAYHNNITPRQFISPRQLNQVHSPQKFFNQNIPTNSFFRGGSPQPLQFQRRRVQNEVRF